MNEKEFESANLFCPVGVVVSRRGCSILLLVIGMDLRVVIGDWP